MQIVKWDPREEIDRFFDDRLFPYSRIGFDTAVDVFEEKGDIVAKMSLPGVDAKDLDIVIDEDMLVISGERQEEKETKEKDYYSKEIRRGSFARNVRLPKSVDAKKTRAQYTNGILTVTMPALKGEETKAVTVAVTQ